MRKIFTLIFKKILKDECGAALALALILVAVGSLMLVPLLSFVGSSFRSTDRVYDQKSDELYAADAGIREAVLRIKTKDSLPVNIGDTTQWLNLNAPDSILNNKKVRYQIQKIDPLLYNYNASSAYRIVSEAGVDPTNNSNKTITTADIPIYNFFDTFTNNAITSNAVVNGGSSQVVVSGNLQAPGENGVDLVYYTHLTQDAPKHTTSLVVDNPLLDLTTNDYVLDHFPPTGKVTVITQTEQGLDKTEKNITYVSVNGTVLNLQNQLTQDHYVGDLVYLQVEYGEQNPDTNEVEGWPPSEEGNTPVQDFYLNQIPSSNYYAGGTVDLSKVPYTNPTTGLAGPLYFEGDTTIKGDFTLGGVVYVNGNVTISNTANANLGRVLNTVSIVVSYDSSDLTLEVSSVDGFPPAGYIIVIDQNGNPETLKYRSIIGHSITLAEAPSSDPQDDDTVKVWMGQTIFCTGTMTVNGAYGGPGAFISIGDMQFQPNTQNNNLFVYVMSVDGIITFQPSNIVVFYGSIAGNQTVNLSNIDIEWQSIEENGYNLNIPGAEQYNQTSGKPLMWIIK